MLFVEASSLGACTGAFVSGRVDLIVADARIPFSAGQRALEWTRRWHPSVRLIALPSKTTEKLACVARAVCVNSMVEAAAILHEIDADLEDAPVSGFRSSLPDLESRPPRVSSHSF
jgi:hypothetical protein